MYNQFKESLIMGAELIGKQAYFTKESVKMQALIFFASDRITEEDKDEIIGMLQEPVVEVNEEPEEIIEE